MIISINRPISDPGICGTGGTNFDSEKTYLFFAFTLEIKLGISTLSGENTFSRLQFMGNFSFFPSFFFRRPDQVNTVRLTAVFGANNLL